MRQEFVLKLALIAAQLQKRDAGFRPKDVRFLYEQLWNWQSYGDSGNLNLRLHNTQIQRLISGQVAANLIQEMGRGLRKHFRLTATGALSLVHEVRETALRGSLPEFLLACHFLSGYREKILMILNTEPLDRLLEVRALLKERRELAEKELDYWKNRIREIRDVVRIARGRIAKNDSPERVVEEIASRYPYELNYQKPLLEVFDETDRPLMVWELVEGNELRIKHLWEPRIRILESELVVLRAW